jgi:hypothetical protein
MKRLALLWLMAWPWLANAAGPLVPEDNSQGPDFSLRLARAKAPFDYGAQAIDTASRWLGVSLREQASEHITLGMYGGYAYVTQTNNPVTAGLELDGFHAGFSLHAVLVTGQYATLFYALNYTYQKVDHKRDAQTVVIDWSEAQAQLGAIVTLNRKWRLYGGGSYGYIDGEERISGAINRTTNFERPAHAGGFLGLDLNVDASGYVGVEAKTGLTRGAEIYFKRRY